MELTLCTLNMPSLSVAADCSYSPSRYSFDMAYYSLFGPVGGTARGNGAG
jgi:hypothetical protein